MAKAPVASSVDEYIARFEPDVQAVLTGIRRTVKTAAPLAQEAIRYGMPTFTQNGVVLHFAALKKHIGVYPPVRGDDALMRAVRPYAGAKGNLQFPLVEAIPYELIRRIVIARLRSISGHSGAAKRVR